MLERKSLQSLGFLPLFSPSLGLHLLRAARQQPGKHWSYCGWRAEELKATWKQKPAVSPLQGFPRHLPAVCPTPWTQTTRLGRGPASRFLTLCAQTTNTHPFLLAGIALAPRGPGGERAVAGLRQAAHRPGTPAVGHALVGAAEVKGLLFTTAFNNRRASGRETIEQ